MLRDISIKTLSVPVVLLLAVTACGGGGGGSGGGGNGNNNTPKYSVGGTVTGLTGSMVLRMPGSADLTVSSSGTFTFSTSLDTGTAYTVTILTPPTTVVCSLANGTGTIAAANVTNVSVTCVNPTIGGTVSGLTGNGLVLQVNGGNDLAIPVPPAGNASFTFPTVSPLVLGFIYSIKIKTQPAGETCTIVRSSGAVTAAAPSATTAAVACIANTTDPLSGTFKVTIAEGRPASDFRGYLTLYPDGTYIFGLHEDDPDCNGHGGVEYGVYSYNQTSHAFALKNAVIDTNGDCGLGTPSGFLVGNPDGTITFVDTAGNGLTVAPVTSTPDTLVGSWGDNQAFMVYEPTGKYFAAMVRTITQNTATSPGIEDGCYTVTGTNTSGTYTVNLNNCGVSSTQVSVDTNGPIGTSSFGGNAITFAATGSSLTTNTSTGVAALPFIPGDRIVATAVPASTFTVGGTIAGLTGTGLQLRLNGQAGAQYNVSPGAGATTFQFTAQLTAATNYVVSVLAQPGTPTQFCVASAAGAGPIVASNIANVAITCQNSASYTIGGSITGLTGAGFALRVNGYDGVAITTAELGVAGGAATFTFPANTIPANSSYTLGIKTQPAGQTCVITKGVGISLGPNPNNIAINCISNTTAPLSGTYTVLDSDGRKYFNFNPDGTLTTVLASNDPDCGAELGNGLEYGMFTWNQSTGAMQLFDPPALDTNGGCGFWEPGSPSPVPWGYVTRVNNTIEVRETPGGPLAGSATAVESNAGTVVGGWVAEAGNGVLAVFHADGTFMWADTQLVFNFPAGYGAERGCYTVAGGTMTFTIAPTCQPDGLDAYDDNGLGFVFPVGVKTAGPVPFTLNDPNTLTIFGRVFKRTAPN